MSSREPKNQAASEVVDLTSPRRAGQATYGHPYEIRSYASASSISAGTLHNRPLAGQAAPPPPQPQYGGEPEPYDPTRPLMQRQGRPEYAQRPPETLSRPQYGGVAYAAPPQPTSNPYAAQYAPQHPVHGAPAPVQQVPREAPVHPYAQAAPVPQYYLADGGVAPTQYYYQR